MKGGFKEKNSDIFPHCMVRKLVDRKSHPTSTHCRWCSIFPRHRSSTYSAIFVVVQARKRNPLFRLILFFWAEVGIPCQLQLKMAQRPGFHSWIMHEQDWIWSAFYCELRRDINQTHFMHLVSLIFGRAWFATGPSNRTYHLVTYLWFCQRFMFALSIAFRQFAVLLAAC